MSVVAAVHRVVALLASEYIKASAAIENIVRWSARESVVACASLQRVAARSPVQNIVTCPPKQPGVALGGVQGIGGLRALQDIRAGTFLRGRTAWFSAGGSFFGV